MKKSQGKTTGEFVFWFTSLFTVSLLSIYVLNLRLEDLGSSTPYVPPAKKKIRLTAEPQNIDESPSHHITSLKPIGNDKANEKIQTKEDVEKILDEDEVEELFVRALQDIDRGKWQAGEKALLKIISQDSENVEALRELAMLNLLDKKNPALAKTYFEKSFFLDPNDTGVMNELLQLYEESGSIKEGLSFLKSIPEDKKTTPAVDYGIATALSTNGRVEEAASLLPA